MQTVEYFCFIDFVCLFLAESQWRCLAGISSSKCQRDITMQRGLCCGPSLSYFFLRMGKLQEKVKRRARFMQLYLFFTLLLRATCTEACMFHLTLKHYTDFDYDFQFSCDTDTCHSLVPLEKPPDICHILQNHHY